MDVNADIACIAQNVRHVRARMDAACRRSGRDPADVELLAVSKTIRVSRLRNAVAAGLLRFGENKIQEATEKSKVLADTDIEWSVIGHLQTNKAKHVARFARSFHALDSVRLAQALQRRLDIEERTLDVFVQVNTSGEPSKYGAAPKELFRLVEQVAQFDRLRIRGFMTLAIFTPDLDAIRRCFALLRTLRDECANRFASSEVGCELSMGMSADFEIAIEEGATIVRVGQAIFGPRDLPDSHYWPARPS